MPERSLQAVPRAVMLIGLLLLALQIGLRATQPLPTARAQDLPPPPSSVAAQLASLGEPITLARLEARPIATLSLEAQERRADFHHCFALSLQAIECFQSNDDSMAMRCLLSLPLCRRALHLSVYSTHA